ncbi:MAG: hypothetical protein NC078_04380 [Ruminococcus sp.]|nr:hypothetical protein [Ruminococcus sp.]
MPKTKSKKGLPKKYIWLSLAEAIIIAGLAFLGGCMGKHFTFIQKNASALVYFTNAEETEMTPDYGIDYTARKVSLLRQACLSAEALEAAVKDTSLSVSALTDFISVERLGNSAGAEISLSGLPSPGEAPIILVKLVNFLQNNFTGGEFKVISYCDTANEPIFPYTAAFLCGSIAIAGVYFKIAFTVRKNNYSKKKKAVKRREANGNAPRPVPDKRYIETAMIRAQSLGTADSTAPKGLGESGYVHASNVLQKYALNTGKCAVIAVCAAHKPAKERPIPADGIFAAYLSCALAEEGCRTALIECDLKNPVMGKIFRKTGKGGLADMAAGSCTVWDILLPNARKGVDIICDKKAYPAPPAVFSASCFGELIEYLSNQYDVILLHTPKGWSCPEWDLIYRFCTGAIAVTEEGEKPDKACAMGILDSKNRFTGLAGVRDLPPEGEETAAEENEVKGRQRKGKKPAKNPKGIKDTKKDKPDKAKTSTPKEKTSPPVRQTEEKRDVVMVRVPGEKV